MSKSSELLRYRPARIGDVEPIVALVQRSYRGPSSQLGWTSEAHLLDGQRTDREEVQDLVLGPHSRIVLAELDGALVGCVLLKAPVSAEGAAYVGMFAVEPTLQARGIGRGLLGAIEHIARSEGLARRLRMTVIAQRTELIAWYERCGYARTGAFEPFPYGDPRAGLPRSSELVFAVLEKEL